VTMPVNSAYNFDGSARRPSCTRRWAFRNYSNTGSPMFE